MFFMIYVSILLLYVEYTYYFYLNFVSYRYTTTHLLVDLLSITFFNCPAPARAAEVNKFIKNIQDNSNMWYSSSMCVCVCQPNKKRSVLEPMKYFFFNNIFYLKRNCVLCALKNSFAIFLAWRTYTYIHTRFPRSA